MFGRSKNKNEVDAATAAPTSTTPTGKKGRPTPKRKAAEAARIHPLVPADRKEAKRAARAARNARWDAEQRALVTGEERYLPARDKGRARRFARDYVDARRSISEWVLAFMMASLIMLMLPAVFADKIPAQWQEYILLASSVVMYGSFIATAVEAFFVWRTIKATFTESHPREDIPRGTGYYTFSRMIMPRRWRSPRPQVERGQFPK